MHAMPKPEDDPEAEVRALGVGPSFSNWLARHAHGDTNHRLTQMLDEVAAALNQYLQDFGGLPKAEITLKCKFRIEKGVAYADLEPSIKLPKPPEYSGLYFIDGANHFCEEDPRQMNMGFPSVGPRRPR